jgi:hypothetical protein
MNVALRTGSSRLSEVAIEVNISFTIEELLIEG